MSTPTTETHCAWCAAERGEACIEGMSHGICERHAEQIRYQALAMRNDPKLWAGIEVAYDNPSEDYAVHGHRPDQIVFSVFVCLGCGALGFALGIAVAVWRVVW